MKEDYDFVSKSTGFFIEITKVVPYREATFDGPAEGGDVYFRVYDESGRNVTNELNYLEETSIEKEARDHLEREKTLDD